MTGLPGDSTDSRGHRAALGFCGSESKNQERNHPRRTGAPQPLGGGAFPRCCHGTRHQHSLGVSNLVRQPVYQLPGQRTTDSCRRQHKGVFSGAGAQKPEIKAVPSGGPEAFPSSWAAPGVLGAHCRGRGITASSAPSSCHLSICLLPFLPLIMRITSVTPLVSPGLSSQCRPRFNPLVGRLDLTMSQLETQLLLLLLLLPSRFGRLLMSQSTGSGCTAQSSQHTRSSACGLPF